MYICTYVPKVTPSGTRLLYVSQVPHTYVVVALFPLSMHQASCGNKLEDKAKEVKDQYASELSKLQKELKQLKAAKKEHQKALKQQASTDRELKALKKDLEDMKKQRVKLMHKMRDEATRNRQEVGIAGGVGWGGYAVVRGVCILYIRTYVHVCVLVCTCVHLCRLARE